VLRLAAPFLTTRSPWWSKVALLVELGEQNHGHLYFGFIQASISQPAVREGGGIPEGDDLFHRDRSLF
jgi:hypothetical protein